MLDPLVPRNTLAIGDRENDHELLRVAEIRRDQIRYRSEKFGLTTTP